MKEENSKYLALEEEHIDMLQGNMPPDEDVYDLADLFKMFADSTRLKIMCLLFQKEMCVNDVATILSMTQSAISHQLRVLKQSKLIKSRRDGKIIFYSLTDEHINKIINNGLEHIEE